MRKILQISFTLPRLSVLHAALKREKRSFASVCLSSWMTVSRMDPDKIALPPLHELERANDNFVGPFIVTCNDVQVPGFLTSAFDFLEKNGYDKIEGVFRKEGNWKRTNQIAQDLEEHGRSFEDVEHLLTVHDVCYMVKKYLAKYRILSEIKPRDGRDLEINVMDAVNNLTSHKKATLAYLMGKLNKVQRQTSFNRMDSHSLAVLFNPCLFGPDNFDSIRTSTPLFTQRVRIIEILIKNYGRIESGQFEKSKNQNLRKLPVSSDEKGNQKRAARKSFSDIATSIQKCFRRVTRSNSPRIGPGPSTRNGAIRSSSTDGIMKSKKAPVTLQMNSARKSRIANRPNSNFWDPPLSTANAARSAAHMAFDEVDCGTNASRQCKTKLILDRVKKDSTHKQCLFTSKVTIESEHDCDKAKHTSAAMRIPENWVAGTEFFQNLSKRIPVDESGVPMRESVCRLKQLAVVSSLQPKWEEVTLNSHN